MASYAYRCPTCGEFEVSRSVHAASTAPPCPRCGGAGRRVFTAPALVGEAPALARALEADRRSAHEPAVVSGPPPPPRPARPVRPADPSPATLPRP